LLGESAIAKTAETTSRAHKIAGFTIIEGLIIISN
jgi:hypothetical protein